MRLLTSGFLAVVAMLVGSTGMLLSDGRNPGSKGSIAAERNTKLSDFVYRLGLVSTAGADAATGAFFIKLYRLPQGSECDTDGAACKGVELVVSAASLDLDGDNALYRVTGLSNWEFIAWKGYAEYDAPDYTTSFTVRISAKPGQALPECKGGPLRSGQAVTFAVNPWKMTCEVTK